MKKYYFIMLMLLSVPCFARIGPVHPASVEFHYNDCVEITGGFFYQPGEQTVERVWDKRTTNGRTEYRIGNILFGIWIEEYNIQKVSDKICEELERKKK